MAWSLSSEEQAAVRDQFEAMDENCQGTITLAELRNALIRSDVAEETVEPIFRALDGAKDEEIHYSEFLAAMVSTRIALHDELLNTTFRRFDVDNSGYITVENLKDVLGDSFDGIPIEALLKEADFKRDNKISYEEFIHFLGRGGGRPSMRQATLGIIDSESKGLGADPWATWQIRRSMTYANFEGPTPRPSETEDVPRKSGHSQTIVTKRLTVRAAKEEMRRAEALRDRQQESFCGEALWAKIGDLGLAQAACCWPAIRAASSFLGKSRRAAAAATTVAAKS